MTLTTPAREPGRAPAGTALADRPLAARHQAQAEAIRYARTADRVVIYHPDGLVVAVVEIVSPGNKSSTRAIETFADKAAEFLLAGVHLLVVDLFPPTRRDPPRPPPAHLGTHPGRSLRAPARPPSHTGLRRRRSDPPRLCRVGRRRRTAP